MKTVPLTTGGTFVVDDADYERVSTRQWHVHAGKRYACTRIDRKHVLLHRLLLDAKPGEEGDHRDGDTLNNQRANLRICTHAENMRNRRPMAGSSSRFLGVSFDKASGRWEARLKSERRQRYLGHYDIEEDAARAYDAAAIALHGEFARPNFPDAGRQQRRAKPLNTNPDGDAA